MLAGLIPQSPEDMAGEPCAVYLFGTIADLEDAVSNWLGERFADDEELVALKIETDGLALVEDSFEFQCYETISPDRITILTGGIL